VVLESLVSLDIEVSTAELEGRDDIVLVISYK
jgi:hypothetical protein